MSAPKWHEGPMAAFDIESTGVNVHTDRIVTAAIVHTAPGKRPRSLQWVLDPGTDIPTEAAEVHGWTRDRVLATVGGEGRAVRVTNGSETARIPVDTAIYEIATQVAQMGNLDVPLIAFNAAYDLSILDTECARHDVTPIADRPKGHAGVVDPMVIERQYDPFRKVKGGCRGGKHKCGGCGAVDKKLTSLCVHYGVRHTGAHDAAADALASVRLTARLAGAWPEVARLKLATLHTHQVTWRREQMASLKAYFDRAGTVHDGMCGSWPVHGACCAPAVVRGVA